MLRNYFKNSFAETIFKLKYAQGANDSWGAISERLIDDVCGTRGGTMKALLQALSIAGANVADVCIAVQRGEPDIGRPYKSLVRIEVTDKVYVVERHL